MTTYDEFRAQYPDGEIPTHLLSAYDEARTTWALDLADTAEAAAAEAATATGPEALTRRAVAELLTDPQGLRRILDELMTQALRLRATPEWEMEDNRTVTEYAVRTLAAYLPEATPHQSAEICEHFGLEFDEIDTTWFPQPAWDTPTRTRSPPTTARRRRPTPRARGTLPNCSARSSSCWTPCARSRPRTGRTTRASR